MGVAALNVASVTPCSILGGVPLNAVNVDIAVRHAARALTFENHATQAFHGGMVRLVQGLSFVAQQFHRLPNAAGLVNAALLADGQMHGQVQKGVFFGGVNLQHAGQGGVYVGQFGMVLGVLVDPLAG